MKHIRTAIGTIMAVSISEVTKAMAAAPAVPIELNNGGMPAPTDQASIPLVLLFVTACAVILLVIAKLADLARSRREAAALVESTVNDALLNHPSFLRSGVAAIADVSFWRGSPARIELRGLLPSRLLAQTALRVAAEAAARIRPDYVVEDRLGLCPTGSRDRAIAPVAGRPRVAALQAKNTALKQQVTDLTGALQAATGQLITARRLYLEAVGKTQ